MNQMICKGLFHGRLMPEMLGHRLTLSGHIIWPYLSKPPILSLSKCIE